MNSCSWRICRLLVCGLIACCLTLPAAAAESKAPAPKPAAAPSDQEMMAAMMKLATPGPQHAALKPLEGSWKATVKSFMGPGEPAVSEGTAENQMILGGRFLRQEYHGTFMGQPFEGYGVTGYDNAKKQYVGAWVDSVGTMIQTTTGSMDKSGKVLTLHGTWDDPVTHKKTPTKQIVRITDDKTNVFEMYGQMEGKEVKQMEITYTRK
jgi:hypothetical protein